MTIPILKSIGVSRLRMGIDGEGVTTLVCAWGCPLRCAYCLNPHCFNKEAKTRSFTPQELYSLVKKDEIYFCATGGGITFGGGEPLVNAEFISCFRSLCGSSWKINAETCLNLPREMLKTALCAVNTFIIDIKDMDAHIYKRYTGRDNTAVIKNLEFLAGEGRSKDVVLRLPLIPGFNSDADRARSRETLEKMGFSRFDEFSYVIKHRAQPPCP